MQKQPRNLLQALKTLLVKFKYFCLGTERGPRDVGANAKKRLFRLAVRMSPLHGEDTGSIPVKDKLRKKFVFYVQKIKQRFPVVEYVLKPMSFFKHKKIQTLRPRLVELCALGWSYFVFCNLWWIPHFGLRAYLFTYFRNKITYWITTFLNEFTLLLTTEWLLAYRYLLTILFFGALLRKLFKGYYRAIRRPIFDAYISVRNIKYLWLGWMINVVAFVVGIWAQIAMLFTLPFLRALLPRIYQYFCSFIIYVSKACINGICFVLVVRHHFFLSSIVVYYTFTWHLHFFLTLMHQMRICRLMYTRMSNFWQPKFFSFYTIDEIAFFLSGLKRFLFGVFTVRLHDMNIPTMVDMGYPVTWMPKPEIIKGVFDSGSYFFWSTHANLDQTLLPRLQKYQFIPYDLTVEKTPELSLHLQMVLHWAQNADVSREHKLVVEDLLNELYFAFHDHFRLSILTEIDNDPFFLIRLLSSPELQVFIKSPRDVGNYIFNVSDDAYIFPQFQTYCVDNQILERVCEHWSFVKVSSENLPKLMSPEVAEGQVLASQLEKSRVFDSTTESSWSSWEFVRNRNPKYTIKQWYDENWNYYIQQYIDSVCFYFLNRTWGGFGFVPGHLLLGNISYNRPPYYDDFGWIFPIYSLQGLPWQDTWLFPCLFIYMWAMAMFLHNCTHPLFYEWLVYEFRFIDINVQFEWLFGIDVTDTNFKEIVYWIAAFVCIPFYYIPNFKPYYRRRLLTYSEIEYTRYIRQATFYDQSVEPYLTTEADYFHWHLSENLTPLAAMRDKQKMKSFHTKRYRARLTFRQGLPYNVPLIPYSARWYRRRLRRHCKHAITNGFTFLEQDWLFSYFQWEARIQRFQCIPAPGPTDIRTHTDFLREYHFYTETSLLKWYSQKKSEKTMDYHRGSGLRWFTGFWRPNEVLNVSRKVAVVPKTTLQKHEEYKEMVRTTLDIVHRRSISHQAARLIRRLKAKEIAVKDIPNEIVFQFQFDGNIYCVPVNHVTLDIEQDQAAEALDEILRPVADTPLQVYRFDKLAIEIRDGIFKTQFHKDRYAYLPAYRFFHFMKCLPPVLDLGPIEGVVEPETFSGNVTATLVAFLDYWSYLQMLWKSMWEIPKPVGYHFGHVPHLLTPADNLVDDPYYEAEIRMWTDYSEKYRYKRKKNIDKMFIIIQRCNQLIDKVHQIRTRLRYPPIKVWKWKHDVNFLTFFTEQVICPPFGKEEIHDGLDLHLVKEKPLLSKLLPWGSYIENSAKHGSHRYMSLSVLNSEERQVSIGDISPTRVTLYDANNSLLFRPTSIWHLIYYRLVYVPLRRRWRRFWYRARQIKIKILTLNGLLKYKEGIAVDTSIITGYTTERVGRRKPVSFLHNHPRKRKYRKGYVLFEPVEWNALYERYTKAMYGKFGTMVQPTFHIYVNEHELPDRREYDLDYLFHRDIRLHKVPKKTKQFLKRFAFNRVPLSLVFNQLTHEDYMSTLMRSKIRYGSMPAHAFEGTIGQYREALEEEYQFNNRLFKKSKFAGRLRRGRVGSIDAKASHYNLYQKYQPSQRVSQHDFRRSKYHKPGTPDVSQHWYYYDRYTALKKAVHDRYLAFWPLEKELVSCLMRPTQYITTPTSIVSDLNDPRRRFLVKGRIFSQATASSLKKYNAARVQLPTRRSLDLIQADVEKVYPTTLQQHRYMKGLFTQQAIANVYWRLFRTWAPVRNVNAQNKRTKKPYYPTPNKWKYSFREWLRLDPDILSYFEDHHDRLRFLKQKKLSFSSSIYERLIETKRHGWGSTDMLYGRLDHRMTRREKRTKKLISRLRTLNEKFSKWYGFRMTNHSFWYFYQKYRNTLIKVKHISPHRTGPWNLHIFDAIKHIEDPSERLEITLKLFENHNVDRNHKAIMDFFFNDLAVALRLPEDLEPKLGDFENSKETSLPGTVISPTELRNFWNDTIAFGDYKRRLEEFFNYVAVFYALNDRHVKYTYHSNAQGLRTYNLRRFYSPKYPIRRPLAFVKPEDEPTLHQWGWSKKQWTWDMHMLTELENLAITKFMNKLDQDWNDYLAGIDRKRLERENLTFKQKIALEKKEKKKAAAQRAKYLTFLNEDVLATDLEMFPINPPTFEERVVGTLVKESQKRTRLPFTGDDLRDTTNGKFIAHPTGYIRTTGSSDEDFGGWREYLMYTRNERLRSERANSSLWAGSVRPRFKRKVARMSRHLDKRTAIEWKQNPLIFADTPNSFAEYASKEFLFDWEWLRIDRHLRQEADIKVKPYVQKLARDPKTRKRFYHKHFSYFFDVIRRDWSSIYMTREVATQILKEFLIPELKTIREKELLVQPTSRYTTPLIKQYRSTYFFDILPDLITFYENREETRKEKEAGVLDELAYTKKKYKGRYYTSIREYLVEGLEYELAQLEGLKHDINKHTFWKKGGYLWETKVLADWFVWCDTLGEIELRDPLDYVKKNEQWIINEKLMNPFYTLPHYVRSENGLNHYIYLTRSYYQDFEIRPEWFTVNRAHWSDDIDPYNKYSFQYFWQRKSPLQKHINSMLLTKTQNIDLTKRYGRVIDVRQNPRGLYYDGLGDNITFSMGVQDRVIFQGQNWWVYQADGTEREWLSASSGEFELPAITVQFFTPQTYFYPWYRFPQKLSHIRDECLVAGLYNITQLTMTPVQFFTQAIVGGNGGAIDLFGVYCDRGMALAPYEWFDFYDPITNRVVNTTPNLNYIFKEGRHFRRYFGYFTPSTTWERFVGRWSIVDKIESIASGYTELESVVGAEYAISYTFNKYLGVMPAYIFDFLLYTSYWGYAWVNAIYHGSFIDSHIDKIKLMTPQDGLLELGLTGKEYERSLRALQLKVLHSPEINFEKILLAELQKRELYIVNNYCYGITPDIELSKIELLKKLLIDDPLLKLYEEYERLDRIRSKKS